MESKGTGRDEQQAPTASIAGSRPRVASKGAMAPAKVSASRPLAGNDGAAPNSPHWHAAWRNRQVASRVALAGFPFVVLDEWGTIISSQKTLEAAQRFANRRNVRLALQGKRVTVHQLEG